MTSGGNNFNDFPEIVPTRKITTKIEKMFFSSVAVGLFLEWAQCCSIDSTRLNATLTLQLCLVVSTQDSVVFNGNGQETPPNFGYETIPVDGLYAEVDLSKVKWTYLYMNF